MKTNIKIVHFSLVMLLAVLMCACNNKKDEPSYNNSYSYSDDDDTSSDISSGSSSSGYDIYRVTCFKLLALNSESMHSGDASSSTETRYIWHELSRDKKYLCRNSYSFSLISTVSKNSYSTLYGYPIGVYKYYAKDPGLSSSTYYFFDDGTLVSSGSSSGSSSGGSSYDGGSSSSSGGSSVCTMCHGSGKCWNCHGLGYVGSASYHVDCFVCHGSKICKSCNGTGYR